MGSFLLVTFVLIQTIHPALNALTFAQVQFIVDQLRDECISNNSRTALNLRNAGKLFCPTDLDSYWNCWGATEAGTSVELKCSKYFFKNALVSRKCLENGTWEDDKNSTTKSCTILSESEFLKERTKLLNKFGIVDPSSPYPCEINNGGCEQGCKVEGENNLHRCTCNDGYILNSDGKTCTKQNVIQENTEKFVCPINSGVCVVLKDGKPIPRPDGNYQWPGNPHCFIQCVNGLPYCQCCNPKKLYFVEICNKCLDDANAGCSFSLTDPPTTPKLLCNPEKATTRCNNYFKQSGSFPSEESRQEYITCVYGISEYKGYCGICPAKLVWVAVSNNAGVCDWPNRLNLKE